MTTLSEHIEVRSRFARSTSLERDADGGHGPLDEYILTARALDVVERVVGTLAEDRAGGAWSITGPYGAGKSTLALFLDALLGPPGPHRSTARRLLKAASPDRDAQLRIAHERYETADSGVGRALVTANRETISRTLLRGLHSAVLRRYGEIPSAKRFAGSPLLRRCLQDAEDGDPARLGPSPSALVDLARHLASDTPLLLVIDEFGKNLEAVRDNTDADPYLLQQLAEAGQGDGLPILLVTLQHLSFEDYFAAADDSQRREWAKVQGRFEDVVYVDSPEQTRALIRSVFDRDERIGPRIGAWAKTIAGQLESLGLRELSDPSEIAACYPLHPIAAAALPEMCTRYGQNERSLFTFLAGPDPTAVPALLPAKRLGDDGDLPTIDLADVYDHFGGGGSATIRFGSARWTEVTTRIRDVHGLSTEQSRLARSVALLNLVSISGSLRASAQALSSLTGRDVSGDLAQLVGSGVLTYRDYADEYRVWQGTDVDIVRLLDEARPRVANEPLPALLQRVLPPEPVVVARHSAETDTLRVFRRAYVSAVEMPEPEGPQSPYDGTVGLVVAGAERDAKLPDCAGTAPVVVAFPRYIDEVERAAREVATVDAVLADRVVAHDWVARRELAERRAEAELRLGAAVDVSFRSEDSRWFLVSEEGLEPLPAGRGTAPLSAAADRVYDKTPIIRNEILNRSELTSQGARARRVLLGAMIERGEQERLGLEGHGPEVAMYEAALAATGIHRFDRRNDSWMFAKPEHASLRPAWTAIDREFRRAKGGRVNMVDIYAALMTAPIGMKHGAVPVVVSANLLARTDDIAIYEHGTFRPTLTPDMLERMVRNPAHFDVKHFANTSGGRRQVVERIADRLGIRPGFKKQRVGNVLSVVGAVVRLLNGLENYTLQTEQLSDATRAVRDTLLSAVEPDLLLFDSLPASVGLPAVAANTKTYGDADLLADSLRDALQDLTDCYARRLDTACTQLLDSFGESERASVAGQARALEGEVLDAEVRAFVLTLASDAHEDDRSWIEAVATVVSGKAPAEWREQDSARFDQQLPAMVAATRRLIALHAESRLDPDGPFEAFRVSFTHSTGREEHRIAAVDAETSAIVAEVAADAVEQLAKILGSEVRAVDALLASLGTQIVDLIENMPVQARGGDEAGREVV